MESRLDIHIWINDTLPRVNVFSFDSGNNRREISINLKSANGNVAIVGTATLLRELFKDINIEFEKVYAVS